MQGFRVFFTSQCLEGKKMTLKAGNWGEFDKETLYEEASRVKEIVEGLLKHTQGSWLAADIPVLQLRRALVFAGTWWGAVVAGDHSLMGVQAFSREM